MSNEEKQNLIIEVLTEAIVNKNIRINKLEKTLGEMKLIIEEYEKYLQVEKQRV